MREKRRQRLWVFPGIVTQGPESPYARTLEAYRREKRAQLHDRGEAELRQELARLETWLARSMEQDGWHGAREMEVDVEFRRAKARVLREILAQSRK